MKAIYINLDPYLQAVADWLNAGKPGTSPCFDPLPVAVTIPLGQDVVLLVQGNSDEGEDTYITVDGQTVNLENNANPETDTYYGAFALSAFSGFTYWTRPVTGNTSITFHFRDSEDTFYIPCTIPVLVRRETASGPVDLVDFTPPAAAPSAADIKSALVAAGSGALEGVSLAGTVLNDGEVIASDLLGDGLTPCLVGSGDTITATIGASTQS